MWYTSGAFNNAFLQRSHAMNVAEAGYWISVLAAIAGIGTFLGGYLSRSAEQPRSTIDAGTCGCRGSATLICVPFQFLAYLSPSLAVTLPSFVGLMLMAAVFFGPSFAMTQALATLRMRSVATSVLAVHPDADRERTRALGDRLHQRPARCRRIRRTHFDTRW